MTTSAWKNNPDKNINTHEITSNQFKLTMKKSTCKRFNTYEQSEANCMNKNKRSSNTAQISMKNLQDRQIDQKLMTKTDAQDYIQLCCNGIGWKQKFKSWDIKPQQARGCWFQLGVSEKMDVPWSSMFQKTSKNSPAILGLLRLPWQKGPPNPQRIPWPCQVNLGFVVLATQLRLGGSSSVRRFPVAKAALRRWVQLGQGRSM